MDKEKLTRLMIEGGVARLEICREKVLNALSRQVVDELDAHLERGQLRRWRGHHPDGSLFPAAGLGV